MPYLIAKEPIATMPTPMAYANRQDVVVDMVKTLQGLKHNDDKQRMQDVLCWPGRRLAERHKAT